MIIENEVINMKLRFDTQEFPGIQVSLTAQELTTQLRHMMHAENLYLREGCVYRGHQFRRSRQSKRLSAGLSRKKVLSYNRFDIAHDQIV